MLMFYEQEGDYPNGDSVAGSRSECELISAALFWNITVFKSGVKQSDGGSPNEHLSTENRRAVRETERPPDVPSER